MMTDEMLLARIEQAKKNRPRVVGVAEAVEEYLHYTTKYDGCFRSIVYLDQESGDVWTETKWAGNEPKPKYENEPVVDLFAFARDYLGIEPTLDENEETGVSVRNVIAWANLCAHMYDAMHKQEQEAST